METRQLVRAAFIGELLSSEQLNNTTEQHDALKEGTEPANEITYCIAFNPRQDALQLAQRDASPDSFQLVLLQKCSKKPCSTKHAEPRKF